MPTPALDPITADVLHSAVHNLKAPADRLRLLVELLKPEGSLDEDTRRILGYITDSARDVGIAVAGLRTYAEICSRPLRLEPLPLMEAFLGAKGNLESEVERCGAEIVCSDLPVVSADRYLMRWLFQELLSNALRFAGPACQVTVTHADAGPSGWYISFADNGPGIDETMAERVFRPFRNADAAGGAGVGLAVCRWIVGRHGGQLWLQTGSRGAEFRFFLGAGEDACR